MIDQQNKCEVCHSDMQLFAQDFKSAVTSDCKFVNSDIPYLYCRQCGCICIDPRQRIDYTKFYASDYKLYLQSDEVEPVFQGQGASQCSVDFLSELIPDDHEKTFFDIGAGKGNILEAFHQRFPSLSYYALEPSAAYKKLIQKDFLTETYSDFYNAQNFHERSFDFISIVCVLEHVSSPKMFLDDIKKVMHDDSILLVEVPNFEVNKYDLLTIDHFSKFTSAALINLFNVCGLEVLKQDKSKGLYMRFAVKKNMSKRNEQALETNIESYLNQSNKTIVHAISDIQSVNSQKVAMYGQSSILTYIIGTKEISSHQISCIIDDNTLYQGLKFQGNINIVSFDVFNSTYEAKTIFLSMNDCYHQFVLPKLEGYNVIGKSIQH